MEFAVRLHGGFLVPLDSKFVASDLLAQLEEGEEDERRRKEAEEEIKRRVQERAREVTKYLGDERTLGFGIAAIPDSVYSICRKAMRNVAERHRIVLAPYSLLVPYILSLYLMAWRLGVGRVGDIERALGAAISALNIAQQRIEGMQRPLKELQNKQGEISGYVQQALRELERAKGEEAALPLVEEEQVTGEEKPV